MILKPLLFFRITSYEATLTMGFKGLV
uniref:Uncharacterized protein n=1 Tax=Anguilla anguilla TaxID=7936 RepID=A0A0E9SRL9_ANGAN